MYKVPLKDVKEKIVESGKLSAEDFDTKIKEKINELSGLITEEGAAHIIANELGVELTKPGAGMLKIKEIYAGMRGVSTVGKVVRKFDVHEFAKGESTGKVCSLILGDETGTIRVVFWNEQVDLLKNVNQEDVLKVENSSARENRGNKEIHLGEKGDIEVNPDGVTVETVRRSSGFERKQIKELEDGQEGVEILGTVVQVYDPRFFQVDKSTGKRVMDGGELSYVMNAVVDDGTGTIRGVFWKNQTNHLVEKSEEEMAAFKDGSFENVKTDLLGEQVKIMGKVKRNDMFDRLEFNVQLVEKAKPEEELKRLEAE